MRGEANILVVDDDAFMHEMYADALAEKYRLCPAEGAMAARQLVRTERPDVIVLDVEMPDMDGYEACRRLKEMDDTANIRVLCLCTGDAYPRKLMLNNHGIEEHGRAEN